LYYYYAGTSFSYSCFSITLASYIASYLIFRSSSVSDIELSLNLDSIVAPLVALDGRGGAFRLSKKPPGPPPREGGISADKMGVESDFLDLSFSKVRFSKRSSSAFKSKMFALS
jgi:hypothetical protein